MYLEMLHQRGRYEMMVYLGPKKLDSNKRQGLTLQASLDSSRLHKMRCVLRTHSMRQCRILGTLRS